MSMTLMDRAKKFMASQQAATALAIVPLAMMMAKPQRTTAAVLFGFDSASSGNAVPGPAPVSVSSNPLPNGGIHITGNVGPLAGADYYGGFVAGTGSYGGGYDYLFTGSIAATLLAGETISVSTALNIQATAGTVIVDHISFDTVSSGISLSDFAPPAIVGGDFSDVLTTTPALSDIPMDGNTWSLVVRLNWTGFSDGDSLLLTIPANSIDITSTPEPATAGIFAASSIALLARRRRHT